MYRNFICYRGGSSAGILVANEIYAYDVFISHRSTDRKFALSLYNELKNRDGTLNIFISEISLKDIIFDDVKEFQGDKWLLYQLIAECTDYDFKQALEVKKPKSWLKSVSAFANTLGGTLFFGVTNDKVAVGVDNPQTLGEKIFQLINERIKPNSKFLYMLLTETLLTLP